MKHDNLRKAVSLTAAAALALTPALSLADTAASALVKGGALNLRETASLDAKVLGQYPTGTLIEITQSGAEWSKVFVAGKTGYMMTKYLDASTGSAAAKVHTNTGASLNLREAPSLAGKIIKSAKNGVAVTVLQKGAAWCRVQVEGSEGFMATQYLSFGGNGGGSTSVPAGTTAVVNNPRATQVLNLRAEATQRSEVLAYYRNGAVVTVLAKGQQWSKVTTADGKTGFMMNQYLKFAPAASEPGTATTFNWNGGKIVNFRSAPNLNKSSIQGTVPVGTKVKVVERGTDWCKVEVDGKTGYISIWFLK